VRPEDVRSACCAGGCDRGDTDIVRSVMDGLMAQVAAGEIDDVRDGWNGALVMCGSSWFEPMVFLEMMFRSAAASCIC
jgi:hypothetical protein